jgi:hypothetical protein
LSVLRKMGMVLALVATVGVAGAVPAVAGPPAAEPGVMAVACTFSSPPAGYYYDRSYDPPNSCQKCQIAGGAQELTGRYRAWCLKFTFAPTVSLYLFCRVCREGEAVPLSRHPQEG